MDENTQENPSRWRSTAALICILAPVLGCVGADRGPAVSSAGRDAAKASGPVAARIGSTPMDLYEKWQVTRPSAPRLDVYVARKDGDRRPLVIFAQGSHCLPLFMVGEKAGRRREVSTFLFHTMIAGELARADFALVERRGLTSFGPPPASEAAARDAAHCTREHGGVSKNERVADLADVVRAMSTQPWVERIFVVGHSEGADVAAGVISATGDRAVAAVGLLSGAGATQFYDFVVPARRNHDDAGVKQVLDEEIWLTGPKARGEYRGADIERQLSYAITSTPVEDLRASRIPIFVAAGTRDDNSPIEAADVFVTEMLRAPDRPVHYLILPGLDHGYRDEAGNEHGVEVLRAFLDWGLASHYDRSVAIGPGDHADAAQR
jgi:pimeloyl-ACP methyl ester carboxylesterase